MIVRYLAIAQLRSSAAQNSSIRGGDVNLMSVLQTIISDFNLAQRLPSQAALQKIMCGFVFQRHHVV
jgi:hypothetical protein